MTGLSQEYSKSPWNICQEYSWIFQKIFMAYDLLQKKTYARNIFLGISLAYAWRTLMRYPYSLYHLWQLLSSAIFENFFKSVLVQKLYILVCSICRFKFSHFLENLSTLILPLKHILSPNWVIQWKAIFHIYWIYKHSVFLLDFVWIDILSYEHWYKWYESFKCKYVGWGIKVNMRSYYLCTSRKRGI